MALEMGARGSRAYQAVQQQDAKGSTNRVPDEDTTTLKRLPPRTFPNVNRPRYLACGVLLTCLVVACTVAGLTHLPRFKPSGGVDDFGSMVYDGGYTGMNSRLYPLRDDLANKDMSCGYAGYVKSNGSDAPGAFGIDLRSTKHFTFAGAKLVDVLWDLFVGQGGRFLLAWISYRVLMDALTRLMETSPVSYQVYTTLAFEMTSLFTAWGSLTGLVRSNGWRARAFMAWSAIATIYVLAFPTLMGAATGYVNPSNAYFRMTDSSLLPFPSSKIFSCFIVDDGSRVGIEDGQLVVGAPIQGEAEAPSALYKALNESLSDYEHFQINKSMFYNDAAYGREPTNFITKKFTTNITIDNRQYVLDRPLDLTKRYCYNNVTIPDDLQPQCIPESYFVWGFSSMILYITIALQLVWTIGMAAVWLESNINSKLCRRGRKLRGSLRAAVDVAEAVQEVLGDDLCTYSDSEIGRELTKGGKRLKYYVSEPDDDSVAHIGISSSRDSKFYLRTDVLYGRKGLR